MTSRAGEWFFIRVQLFMSLPIVLPGKTLATDLAEKGSFVCMRPLMGAQIVGSRKCLVAALHGTDKRRGVLLLAVELLRILFGIIL